MLQTKERILDLGAKILHAVLKQYPDIARYFNFMDADGRPITSELRRHGLKTFVAFGDIVDGLDNVDKTAQIFEHLVRCGVYALVHVSDTRSWLDCAQGLTGWLGPAGMCST